ncbi:MAG: YbhB/YbcL family Raf kinase inhibitor-like protein [Planctomycetota bacterium]
MNALRYALLVVAAAMPALAGCDEQRDNAAGQDDENSAVEPPAPADGAGQMVLTCPAFEHGEAIPAEYTADGADVSPPLAWRNVPQDARELALIMEDPDAPRPDPWVHWVIYRVDASADGLPRAVPRRKALENPPGALQGRNSRARDNIGYRGPAPPSGTHRYFFRLYALDAPLSAGPGLTADELRRAMDGHVIATATLMGTYTAR